LDKIKLALVSNLHYPLVMNAASLSATDLQYAEYLWPKAKFSSEAAWTAYVSKWYPRIVKAK
jgi:hypothetical protein